MDNNNFDDIFNEDFDFKPLTDGLGFHDKKEFESKKGDIVKRSMDLKRDLEQASKNHEKITNNELDLGDLAPFYGKESLASKTQALKEQVNSTKKLQPETHDLVYGVEDKASVFIRFFAWVLDITVIMLTFLAALSLIVIGSNIPVDFLLKDKVLEMLLWNTSPLFLLFYVFYFSFLDRTSLSTVGKNLLNLKVVSFDNKSIGYGQSLIRATLNLIGLFTLGFINLLDIQGLTSKTKIVHR
jgi:hypothetical protein